MKKLVLIVESSQRPTEERIAKKYYVGVRSRWINNVIKYVEGTNENNVYFLQISKGTIVKFDELVKPYAKAEITKEKIDNVVKLVSEKLDGVEFVDLHCGKNIGLPLIKVLEKMGVRYKMFADGFPLAMKAGYYEELIAEQEEKQRAQAVRRSVMSVMSIGADNPYEKAMKLIEVAGLSNKYKIEELELIKSLAQKYHKRKREMEKSQIELGADEAEDFKYVTNLAEVYANPNRYEKLKASKGKLLAKIERYLIKMEYFKQAELKLNAALLRANIQLMKLI